MSEQPPKTGPDKYGGYYWCAKSKLSKSGEIYVMADEAKILPDGTLCFVQIKDGQSSINLALAPGHWTACYAASLIDGTAVAVQDWKGEVER